MYVLDDPVDYDLDSQPVAGGGGPPAGRRSARVRLRRAVAAGRQPADLHAAVQFRPRQPRRGPRDDHLAGGDVRALRCRCPLRPDLRRQHDHQLSVAVGPRPAGRGRNAARGGGAPDRASARPPTSVGSTGGWSPPATWPTSTSSTSTTSSARRRRSPPTCRPGTTAPAGRRGYRWTLKRGVVTFEDGGTPASSRGAGPGSPGRAGPGTGVDRRPTSSRPSSNTSAPDRTGRRSRTSTGT